MELVPSDYHDLLEYSTQAFAVIGTVSPAGQPRLAPIWFIVDGKFIVFETGKKSLKARYIETNPRISLVIMAEGNHLRYLEIRGEVVGKIETGLVALRDNIWKKYSSEPSTVNVDDSFFFKVKPSKVSAFDYRD